MNRRFQQSRDGAQSGKFEEAKNTISVPLNLMLIAGRFFSLAQVLHQLNEVTEALENFKRAIQMEPDNLDAS
jgi:tetratricopeptide (TPR) repeat protein